MGIANCWCIKNSVFNSMICVSYHLMQTAELMQMIDQLKLCECTWPNSVWIGTNWKNLLHFFNQKLFHTTGPLEFNCWCKHFNVFSVWWTQLNGFIWNWCFKYNFMCHPSIIKCTAKWVKILSVDLELTCFVADSIVLQVVCAIDIRYMCAHNHESMGRPLWVFWYVWTGQ